MPASTVGPSLLDRLGFALLVLAPATFLSVPRGINLCLFALFLMAVVDIGWRWRDYGALLDRRAWLVMLALSALFLATGITQILRGDSHWPSFDGPVRMVLGAIVFLHLLRRRVSAVRAFEIGIPLGLLFLVISLWTDREVWHQWDGRFANRFVDPNSLGSQATILTVLCLASIGLPGRESRWLFALKIAGMLAGIYVSLHAQSRGGWLALPAMVVLWYFLARRYDSGMSLKRFARPLALTIVATATIFAFSDQAAVIGSRIGLVPLEAMNWLEGSRDRSATGLRLSMWEASFILARESPWFGFGETHVAALVAHHPLTATPYRDAMEALAKAGPHSDFLAKLLAMGLLGVSAYGMALLLPAKVFWQEQLNSNPLVRAACTLGLLYVAGLIVCGLFNEMLSLKYLCSFFGLMIAALCADALRRPDTP